MKPSPSASWPKLLKAILDDDSKKVTRLLADDPALARRTEVLGQFIASVPRQIHPRQDCTVAPCGCAA
jgi:hypothetical protein